MSVRPDNEDFGRDSDEAAAQWVVKRDRGLSPAEAERLLHWSASEENLAALDRTRVLWDKLDQLTEVPRLAKHADALLQKKQSPAQKKRKSLRVYFGVAASFLIISSLIYLFSIPKSNESTANQPVSSYVLNSSARRIDLPDGSTVELNGDSAVEVEFSEERRQVRLLSGEGYFIVSKDPFRPFIVTGEGLNVRAVGTAFNVKMATGEVSVLVTEGVIRLERDASSAKASVEIVAPPIAAGERVTITRGATEELAIELESPSPSQINQALEWRTTRLVFSDASLQEVVNLFNRYNMHKLVVGDASLAGRRITGTFDADNVAEFIELAQASLDLRAEKESAGTTVLREIR